MKKIFFSLLTFLFASFAIAQNADTVKNETIIKLKNAGLSNDVLKSKIQSSICKFDLSTDGLIALKTAGVKDDVITAMLNKSNGSSLNNNSSTSSSNGQTSIASGIYYCKGQPCELVELEPSVYSKVKSGLDILTGMTYGIAKTKFRAKLSGDKANLQISDKQPNFYFYFDRSNSNNLGNNGGGWFASATSPNEFLLVHFTTTKKAREVVTGSWSSYSGMASGVDDRNKVAFKYEKTSQGVYRVYTEKPLEAGEYCFMYAGGSATYVGSPSQKVYDFGVK